VDGFWYLIDADKEQAFELWAACRAEGETCYCTDEFDPDRIAGPVESYTFLDPQED
jgi:hypothetical protein